MHDLTLYRSSGAALAGGAALAAMCIALEAFTDPVDPLRRPNYVEGLAAPVHVALLLAAIAVMLGLVGLLLSQRRRAGRPGLLGFLCLYFAIGLGEIPHTVLDMAVIPPLYAELGPQQATQLVDEQMYPLIGALAMPALLMFVVGVVLTAWATLRARTLPAWTAVASLAGVALAFATAPLLSIDSIAPYLPHPPVFVYLGLIGYGLALARRPRARENDHRGATELAREESAVVHAA